MAGGAAPLPPEPPTGYPRRPYRQDRLRGQSPRANRGESDALLVGLEVLRRRVVEDEGGHRGLRLHHEARGQREADLFRLEQREQRDLVREVRPRRVAERDADAAAAASRRGVAAESRRAWPAARGRSERYTPWADRSFPATASPCKRPTIPSSSGAFGSPAARSRSTTPRSPRCLP